MKHKLRKRRRTKDLIRGGVSPAVPKPERPSIPSNGPSYGQSDGQSDGLFRSSLNQKDINVPRGIDDYEETRNWYSIGRLMGVIIAIGLLWISILAFLVSRMPKR
jgi:hypothetical protein